MGEHTITLTSKNFEEKVKAGGIMLIDFWAAWCGPCRAFAPIFDDVASKNPDIVFGKINTEEERELAGAFEIRAIPTLAVFRDGILLFAKPGALPGPALEDLVKQVRALDMDKVRQEIAEAQAKEKS
jgi:thioredoxin 1